MKTFVKILPLAAITALFIACGGGDKKSAEVEELIQRRDSLQLAELAITTEINTLNHEIAKLDTNNSTDELTLIKKIALQKNKVVKMSKKLKKLENELASLSKTKSYLSVSVKNIQPEAFNDYILVYGNVEADNYALISPEMGGKVEAIYVNKGQRVKKGTLLLTLNTDAVDKQIKGIKSGLELAKTTFEKQDALWQQGIGSEIQYLGAKNQVETLEAQLETLEAQLEMSQIRAPFDGIVDKIYPKVGEMAGPSFPVIECVSLAKLNIKADVSESYINKIKVGQQVELSFSSNDEVFTTPITRTTKVIDPKSRTFEIELNVNNRGEKIRPNMVSTIKVNVFSSSDAFVVPSLAIRKDITGSYVYVTTTKDGEEIVEKRAIETSFSHAEKTLVTSGLQQGDKVIVKGYHLVSAGMTVKIVD